MKIVRYQQSILMLLLVLSGVTDGEINTQEITKAFKNFLNTNVKYDDIEEALDKLQYSPIQVDGDELVQDFSEKVSALLKSKERVLDTLKTSVEQAKANFSSQQIVKEFDYFNMRDVDEGESLEQIDSFSPSFKINTSYSFVQVPTNIYKYKQSVLKQVEWSKHLDEQFRMNYEGADENLQYQYYGDSSGIFRLFPGSVIPIKEDTGTDLFDCRRRPWYIQASTSPKDIVIVIDVSGSMIGNNIGIAKIATSSLIDTLQENDYFNVITVNKNVDYVIPCMRYLIQATKENKEMLKQAVQDNITSPTSIVEVDAGMDEAFKILRAGPTKNRTSAGCNQAIMFITDGIEGEYAGKDSFQRNNKDKRVRVFSYLVGRMKNPDKEALVKMSCENGGHFYTIDTLGNVWDTVLDYIRIMSRPITHSMNKNFQNAVKATYTPAYLDSAGFGMVMSVSKGVFERQVLADGTVRYNHLIGVVGTDISLGNLTSLADYSKMGTFSHGFILNNNGFVLVHPKFKVQKGYLPVPPNILMDDLEMSLEDEKSTELKEKILGNDIRASKQFQTYWLYDDNRRFVVTRNKYSYKAVTGTDFIAAIAISDPDEHYNSVKGNEEYFNAGIDALFTPEIIKPSLEANENNTTNTTSTQGIIDTASNYTYVDIAPWEYCRLHGKDNFRGIKKPFNARQLHHFLNNQSRENITLFCNMELLNRLLLTAGVVDNVTKSGWDESAGKSVDGLFVATSGGYTKYLSFTNDTKALGNNIIQSKIFHDVVEASQADVDNRNEILTFSTSATGKVSDSTQHPNVFLTKPYWKNGILAAVSGANMDSGSVNKIFMETVVKKIDKGCENSTNVCALIDSFGYIVASNQHTKYTGQFIGQRLGSIVDEFNETGIFKVVYIQDTQAECIHSDEPSSANILLAPAKILLGALSFLLSSTYWFLVQVGILLVSFFEHQSSVKANTEYSEVAVSCTKMIEYYVISKAKVDEQNDWKSFNCELCEDMQTSTRQNCQNCKKEKGPEYRIKSVPGTNLYLLMAQTGGGVCGCFGNTKVPQAIEMIRSTNDWCKQKQNYRKTPSTCFNETRPDHKDSCGNSFIILPSPTLMFIMTVLSFMFFKSR